MACTFYEFKVGLFGGDYYCNKKGCVVNSDIYYQYCRNYDYRDCPIYKQQTSSGCFITTVACQILGLKDNNPILNNLRYFRDHVLQEKEQYYDILKEYDVIGPIVANALMNDKDRQEMAQGLYQYAILPISKLIDQKEYDKAVENYYLMTLMLVNYYGLKHEYNNIKDRDYDYLEFNPTIAGHGRKRVKENNVSI